MGSAEPIETMPTTPLHIFINSYFNLLIYHTRQGFKFQTIFSWLTRVGGGGNLVLLAESLICTTCVKQKNQIKFLKESTIWKKSPCFFSFKLDLPLQESILQFGNNDYTSMFHCEILQEI